MTTKISSILILCIAGLVTISSCKKDDEVTPDPKATIKDSTVVVNATAYDKWVYYSFETGAEVAVADFKTSTAWDIAFHRMDVRVNCGKAGAGNGGTLNLGKVDFTSVTEAPETGYSLNDSIKIMESSAMPPKYVKVPGDTVMTAKWVTYKSGSTGPVYTLSDNIYIVKTATGKYVKVWMKDYFNQESKGGYPTIKYVYQADGSRKFE